MKHVPETSQASLRIDRSGKEIERYGLAFDINEWDRYAVEEAVRIKEAKGGSVVAVTVGEADSDSTLRRCLAMGADRAIRVTDPRIGTHDPFTVAKVLSRVIRNIKFDLVLTGAQSSDFGYSVVGPALSRMLGVPHTTFAKKIVIGDGYAVVNRELEGGLEEIVEIRLPAVITVQTGINEPRYISIMGIKRAMKKSIEVLSLDDLDLDPSEVGPENSWVTIEEMFIPDVRSRVEIIEGDAEEVAAKIVELLRSRGLI